MFFIKSLAFFRTGLLALGFSLESFVEGQFLDIQVQG